MDWNEELTEPSCPKQAGASTTEDAITMPRTEEFVAVSTAVVHDGTDASLPPPSEAEWGGATGKETKYSARADVAPGTIYLSS